MQSLKFLSSSHSWSDLNKKLEELTKSGQAKFAGSTFELLVKYYLLTNPRYQSKLKNVWLLNEVKEGIKKIDNSYDDLDAYQKKRDAERQAELEKARAKQKKDFKFNFVKPRKDWSIYGGWVNAYEPVNKGRLASTQEWKIEKLGRKYY